MLLALVRTYLRPYAAPLAAVVGLQFAGTLAALYLPSLNADIIDNGVVTGDTGYIVSHGGLMLAVSLVQVACSITAVWFSARNAMGFGRDLRAAIFHRVGSFSAREVQQFGAPSLITRETNDVQQVQMLVLMGGTLMVAAPMMMVGGIVMAAREDLGLSWLVLAVVPVLGLSIGLIVRQMVPSFRLMQERIDEVNRLLREQITGVRVVRAFVREKHETARFADANAQLTEVAIRAGRWQAAMFPTVMIVANVATVGVLWFGGHRVEAGQMEVGALTAYIAYLMQIVMSVMMAMFMLMMVPRAAVCAERITEVLHTDSSVVPPAVPVTALPERLGLELDGVSFAYPGADEPVLREVSLRAAPGETVAIVGSTGAGKSTLVNLVPRLFDATGGAVRVGGVDVRDLDLDTLWSRLGLVPQKAFLFRGTVADNLRYGKPDATDAEMWAALEIAQAREFVEAMPDGLQSEVAQGGSSLSGGQRQRMAIARAVIRRPGIYLFDDSFSALDLATDARLRAALRPATRDATVVIVAQRVATIRHADRIVVMEDGAVVGTGTHDELLETCSTYGEIVASQLTPEEVA
ncbi:ABC transporter ATP-binding protein [Nocardioides sp. zg-1228]|uniref:ABC transporter ATP-binding protein n=1 Tax=Nocardioides sp. zg-1228 TaxID=2763008 RepID=UPI001642C10D|nr:ABC transporter ATP-binding protein [Nocardioides sp. zg-1228]MBC2931606.1 ABC transporter ATP-binding protein [Nocardioides sp. zg-1228]QSF57199.1 ABC transporter ATP-binding protein [Nocardioides sp. zg-1228]